LSPVLRVLACCAIVAVVPHHHHAAEPHKCHRHHRKCAAAKLRPQVHVGQPVRVDSTAPLPASAPAPVAPPAPSPASTPAPVLVTLALGDELTAQEAETIWTETHEAEVPVCAARPEEAGWTCEVV
jgi:hypothetical protein